MDLISRQAAIDQLHQSYNLLDAEQRLEDMPSAQPEPDRDMIHLQKEQAYMQGYEDASKVMRQQRWIPCGKCIHADGKHRRCKILDRTINEDYFCYWAEPYREEGEQDD